MNLSRLPPLSSIPQSASLLLVVSPTGNVHDRPRGPSSPTCVCSTTGGTLIVLVLGVSPAGVCTSMNIHIRAAQA